MSALVQCKNIHKAYHNGIVNQAVLHDISFTINAGEFVAIVGPSGNGKSTLLNLLTGIDKPSGGELQVCGSALHRLSQEQLTVWRGKNVGIVFQFFQLIPSLTLLQNVLLPMDFSGIGTKRSRLDRAYHLLELVSLVSHAHYLPGQVSGGQQQRAAIARSLANDPPLLVADEPTGNLDEATAEAVFSLFTALHNTGKTLIMVTHNEVLAGSASRRIALHSGRIQQDQLQVEKLAR